MQIILFVSNLNKIISSNVERFKGYLDDCTINKAKDISYFKTTRDIGICSKCKYREVCSKKIDKDN